MFDGGVHEIPTDIEVVLADLGTAELADSNDRCWQAQTVDCPGPISISTKICTAQYRPPDLLLGNPDFGTDLDMWSLGCLAAEMVLRKMLFDPPIKGHKVSENMALETQFQLLKTDREDLHWLRSLPGSKHCKVLDSLSPRCSPNAWPKHWQQCPKELEDLVSKCLRWRPADRATAESALRHPFVEARPLPVAIHGRGKHGRGSIQQGELHEELLEYLQKCPSWGQRSNEMSGIMNSEMTNKKSQPRQSKSVSASEAKKGLKHEYAGFIDAANPPKTRDLNADKKLDVISSERLAEFARAFRSVNAEWLRELTRKIRERMLTSLSPEWREHSNGAVFMREDLADNAFVYASVQLMKVGCREEDWHTDGGASLLHAAVTIYGTRTLQVKVLDDDPGLCSERIIPLTQRPGSFYVGNLCALEHNVVHDGDDSGCFKGINDLMGEDTLKIAVMIRSNFFARARSRVLNNKPSPAPVFELVNTVTAKHLRDCPLRLPDLGAVRSQQR